MILSETNWQYKQSVSSTRVFPIKKMKLATGAVYNSRAVKDSSHSFVSILCKYKSFTAIILLLIFQFALYDFDIDEYTSNNLHGTTTPLIKTT